MNQIVRPRPRAPAHIAPSIEVLGVDMTLTFLLRFGGSEVYFGDFEAQQTSRSEVARLIGIDAVRALHERLGMKMRVPIGNRWLVAHLAWEGHSPVSIARRVRVTDTTARRYLHEAAAKRPGALPDWMPTRSCARSFCNASTAIRWAKSLP